MPVVSYQYPIVYNPQTSPSFTRISALPSINYCPTYPIFGWVSELSDSWNCRTCAGDSSYFTRYKKGDVIPFLLRLPDQFNTDVQNPLSGWNFTGAADFYVEAEMYGAGVCVSPLYTVINDFCSDWWVYYQDGIGVYQVLFVDTSMLAANEKNFRLHVKAYDSIGGTTAEVWSENFLEIDTDCTPYHVLFESTYTKIDCLGNRYFTPFNLRFETYQPYHKGGADPANYAPTPFYLQRRFLGQLVLNDNTPEVTLDDNDNIIQQKIFSTFGITLQTLIPPYEIEILSAIIRGDFITIDGVQYQNFGSLSKNRELGTMFLVKDLTCQQICTINNRVCD